MSAITIKKLRIDDRPVNSVNIHLRNYDGKCSVKFVSSDEDVYIISTDIGFIFNNQVFLRCTDKKEINVIVDHNKEKIECLISYLNENILIDHESIESDSEKFNMHEDVSVNNAIETANRGNAKDKMSDFMKSLENMKSQWKAELEYDENIKVKIISRGNAKGLFALGEESKELLCNDFVFGIHPKNDLLIIPKELIRNRYKPESNLYIYELVKPDFIKAANLLFKVKVSNRFVVKDLNISLKSLWYFKTPCGTNFDPSKWEVGPMGLPVRVDK